MLDNYLTLQLTTQELLGAAAVLGIANLPLLGETHPTESELATQIAAGCKLLQERHLLRSISAVQWQVDHLLAVLIHWIATPDYYIQVDSWSLTGKINSFSLLFWEQQLLVNEKRDDSYHCTFWSHPEAWLSAQSEMNIPPDTTLGNWELPSLHLQSILPHLAGDKATALSLLRQAGLSSATAEQTTNHLANVTKVSTWQWLNPHKSTQIGHQFLWLATPSATWGGDFLPTNHLVSLRPLTVTDWQQLLTSNTPI